MLTLTKSLGHVDFAAPRPWWWRVMRRLLALDSLARERHDLAGLDDYLLRDIGLTRADVAAALHRPEEHLQLILRHDGDEFQH